MASEDLVNSLLNEPYGSTGWFGYGKATNKPSKNDAKVPAKPLTATEQIEKALNSIPKILQKSFEGIQQVQKNSLTQSHDTLKVIHQGVSQLKEQLKNCQLEVDKDRGLIKTKDNEIQTINGRIATLEQEKLNLIRELNDANARIVAFQQPQMPQPQMPQPQMLQPQMLQPQMPPHGMPPHGMPPHGMPPPGMPPRMPPPGMSIFPRGGRSESEFSDDSEDD